MARLEPASFEVESFELAGDACLELHGRWFGVRGRRFMRPALTAVADGHEQRLLAVLDHKPWHAEDGEPWVAAFPCSGDPGAMAQAQLTVAPDVTVPLPAPAARVPTRRPRRGAPRNSAPRQAVVKGQARRSVSSLGDERESRLRLERDSAVRSHDEAVAELETVKLECERLRRESSAALAAHEAALAERTTAVKTEVSQRLDALRLEVGRERAGARLAAQAARARDAARIELEEAIRERDQACAERDEARRARNGMLAERDNARAGLVELTRRWERTAGLGTRRTLERDAAAVERDRLGRERDAALEQRDRVARERDTTVAERDRVACERDTTVDERDSIARERDTTVDQRDRVTGERDSTVDQRDRVTRERDTIVAERDRFARERDTTADECDRTTEELTAALEPGGAPSEEATLVLSEQPIVPEHTPLIPRTPQPGASREPVETGYEPRAGATPTRSSGDAADVWRVRLLALSALLVAVVIIVALLLTH